MGQIALLDQITADKIAAGEVIERPASIVKELIENSIDAGADSITIEISEGGLARIRVIDNGCGMDRADAEICFQRHATSKIKHSEDLTRIETLGFRGEALPSIASVAEVTLRTRQAAEDTGVEVIISGGEKISVKEIACPVGTSITVDNIFYNLPARRKFMKKPSVEKGYVQDMINRFLLAYPEIHFVFSVNGRQLINAYNQSLLDCIGLIYGSDAARNVIKVQAENNDLKLSGYISLPTWLKSNRTAQSLFINRRYVKNIALTMAAERGYHSLLPLGRHPLLVLDLRIMTDRIDINVHPTKQEIKINEENKVAGFVMQAIADALADKTIIPLMGGGNAVYYENISDNSVNGTVVADDCVKKNEVPQQTGENVNIDIQVQNNSVQITPDGEIVSEITEECSKENIDGKIKEKQLNWSRGYFDTGYGSNTENGFVAESGDQKYIIIDDSAENNDSRFPELEVIGCYKTTYILAEGKQGLYLIDQHAAHERVRFERFSRQFDTNKVESQMLLIPQVLELSSLEKEMLTKYIIEINEMGFILELFGEDTFLIRAVPFDRSADVKGVFMELLDQLKEHSLSRSEFNKSIIALMSCKRAIKANDRLSREEMCSLLDQLAACKEPFTCPHGRPTMILLTPNEISRRFQRT